MAKYRKKYEGKKNCCYLIGYMGYKKKIRLPEEIEGCSRYILCLCGMPGMKEQVEQVTIPANVRILSILQDNPVDENGDHTLYLETSPFKYKFQVEMGNKDVHSIKGLLYSKNEKILPLLRTVCITPPSAPPGPTRTKRSCWPSLTAWAPWNTVPIARRSAGPGCGTIFSATPSPTTGASPPGTARISPMPSTTPPGSPCAGSRG